MNEQPQATQTEAAALEHLADLFLAPPSDRAPEPERYEQLKQAWREYLEAEPVAIPDER